VDIGPTLTTANDIVLNTERLTSVIASMEELLRFVDNSSKKEFSKSQIITAPISVGYLLWALSPRIVGKILETNSSQTEKPGDRDLLAIDAFVQRMHPEDIMVSLRNVLFARRLQVLGESASEEKGRKVNIAFQVVNSTLV